MKKNLAKNERIDRHLVNCEPGVEAIALDLLLGVVPQ